MISFKAFNNIKEANLKTVVADAQKLLKGDLAKKRGTTNILLYKKGNDIISIVPGKAGQKERNAREKQGWKPFGHVTADNYKVYNNRND